MEEEIRSSKFNAALYKMDRFHNYTEIANAGLYQLKEFDKLTGELGCIMLLNADKVLFKETRAKLTEEEKVEGDNKLKAIEQFIKKFPPYTIMGKNRVRNEYNIEILAKHIDEFDSLVRKYQDAHGMDTPDAEGWDEL